MAEMSFDGKSTLTYWGLELEECYVSAPARKKFMLDIPGGNGQIDAMRGLGDPVYAMRTLTAVFRIAERNPQDALSRLLDELEGREVPIVPPDDPNYYWIGEPHVQGAGFRPGANITIVCTIFPWKYSRHAVVHNIPASAAAVRYTWHNSGTRPVVPELTVTQGNVTISANGAVLDLPAGIYTLTELKIPGRGAINVEISGGPLTARYREAIL